MTPKEHLYGALIAIRHDLEAWDGGDDSFKPMSGLCGMVWVATQAGSHRQLALDYLEHKMAQWPEGSGDRRFPVPAGGTPVSRHSAEFEGRPFPSAEAHQFAATNGPQKWDPRTPYGRSRRALLAWLIEQMEQEDLSV